MLIKKLHGAVSGFFLMDEQDIDHTLVMMNQKKYIFMTNPTTFSVMYIHDF